MTIKKFSDCENIHSINPLSQYFSKQFKNIGGNINVKVDLSNYVTKTDLKNIDLIYFIGKKHFDQDGAQNCLVFQSMLKYFTLNSNWITK